MGERRRIRFKEKEERKRTKKNCFRIYIFILVQCFSKNRAIKDTVIPFRYFSWIYECKEEKRIFVYSLFSLQLADFLTYLFLCVRTCTRLSSFSLRSLFPWRKIYRADTVIPVAYLNNDIFFSSLFPFNGDAFVTVYHSFFCILIRLVSIRFMRNDARRRPWTINRTHFSSPSHHYYLVSSPFPFFLLFRPSLSLSFLPATRSRTSAG